MEFIFFIGDTEEHVEALKVEKSCVPSNNFAPFLKVLHQSASLYAMLYFYIRREVQFY